MKKKGRIQMKNLINEILIAIVGLVVMILFFAFIIFGMWVAEYHSTAGIIVGIIINVILWRKEICSD